MLLQQVTAPTSERAQVVYSAFLMIARKPLQEAGKEEKKVYTKNCDIQEYPLGLEPRRGARLELCFPPRAATRLEYFPACPI